MVVYGRLSECVEPTGNPGSRTLERPVPRVSLFAIDHCPTHTYDCTVLTNATNVRAKRKRLLGCVAAKLVDTGMHRRRQVILLDSEVRACSGSSITTSVQLTAGVDHAKHSKNYDATPDDALVRKALCLKRLIRTGVSGGSWS